MKNRFKFLMFIAILSINILFANETKVNLTPQEKTWLGENPKITMAIPKNFPRSYLNENGKLEGMDIDYFNLIEKKLGIKFDKEIMPWHQALKKAMNHEVDVIINAGKIKSREPYLNFSKTYFSIPQAIVSYDTELEISKLSELCGKTIAVNKGSSKARYLKENYPCIKLYEVTDKKDILKSIVMKKAYAGFDNFDSLSGNIKKMLLPNLKFIYFKYMPPMGYARVGVRKDKPILVSIINKAINSISMVEKNRIVSKWLNVELPPMTQYIEPVKKIKLSLKEKEYLKDNQTITVHNEQNYPPYNYNIEGKPKGYSIDYMNLLASKIGINIDYIQGHNWSEFLDMMKNEKLDVMLNIKNTKKRQEFINFTKPYSQEPIAIFSNIENINNFDDLKDKIVTVPNNFIMHKYFKKNYPNLKLNIQKDIMGCIIAVIENKADVFLGNLRVTQYLMREYSLNLKYIAIPQDKKLITKLNIGISLNKPILRDILQKAMDSVTDEEINRLKNRWFATKIEQSNKTKLSLKEREYLKNNSFTYAGDPNWLPFEAFDKQGNYIGIVSEHIDIIEKKLNLKFKKIITKDWLETLELSKNIEVDIISGDAADVVLAKNYKPIDTYIQNPLVIITRDNHPFIVNLNQMKNKKIALGDGAGYGADIVKKYPDIKFIRADTIHTGLLGVKSGKYDIFIGTLSMSDYFIIEMGLEGIKIAGDTGITMNLTLFVNKNKPLLHSIINKAIKSIDEIQKRKILVKWRHSSVEKVIVDYTLIWQILSISIAIILIVLIISFKQRKLKKRIEREKNKFKNIFEKSTDGILILTNGVFTDCNDSIINVLKYKNKKDILSLKPSELSPEFQPNGVNSLEKSKEMMEIAIKNNHNNFEWVHIRADGSEFWSDIMLTNISTDTKDEIIHVVWRDITDKKRLEDELKQIHQNLEDRVKEEVEKNRQQQLMMLQQSRLAQMGEIISMIAHQWRQPLNTLAMINQTLIFKYRRDNLNSDYMEYFKKNSNKQIQGMSKTIDDFRDFFKPKKDKMKFIINDVIDNTLEMLKPIFVIDNIEVIFENQEKFEVIGFANELGQGILNIVNNAKDALIENKIKDKQIIISLKMDSENIILTISDNAGGIPLNIIDKIFDPYFSTKEEKNGTGLGLYMSKIIIEEHMGGKVTVANSKNGAEFTIVLKRL